MRLVKIGSLLLTIAVSASAVAKQDNTFERHTVGMQGSVAGAKYKGSSQDGKGIAQIYAHYNYAFNQMLSLEVGVNKAKEMDNWRCEKDDDDHWSCNEKDVSLFDLDADKLQYTNFIVAVKAQYQLSQRNAFYGKLGAQYYDYKIKRSSTVLTEDDGIGLFAEAGWQYRWDNGIGMNAGLQGIKMDDLGVSGLTVGINYSFQARRLNTRHH